MEIQYTLVIDADAPITIESSRELHRALAKLGLKVITIRLTNPVHNHNIQARASSDAAIAELKRIDDPADDANILDRPIDRKKLFFGDPEYVSEQPKPSAKWQTGTND